MTSANVRCAVILPCYCEEEQVQGVVSGIPTWINQIIVIDDASVDGTADIVKGMNDPRVTLVRHEQNTGVGGAMATGYRCALETDSEILIKMDGDGQMDPKNIPQLIAPLVNGEADCTKGNRLIDKSAIRIMPKARLIVCWILSVLIRVVSGNWSISDPTNGYTAITRDVLLDIDLDAMANDYFFESDMLIHLSECRARIVEVPMRARYGGERHSASVLPSAILFPIRLVHGLVRRMWKQYLFRRLSWARVSS